MEAAPPGGESSEEDEEWDEVEEDDVIVNGKEVEISFVPDFVKKEKNKNREWITMLARRLINQTKKNIQVWKHKVHLLCLLASNQLLNDICNDQLLQALMFSILPPDVTTELPIIDVKGAEKLSAFLAGRFSSRLQPASSGDQRSVKEISLKHQLLCDVISDDSKHVTSFVDLAMLYTIAFRCVGVRTRFVASCHPTTFKVTTTNNNKKKKQTQKGKIPRTVLLTNDDDVIIPQVDGADDSSEGEVDAAVPLRRSRRRKVDHHQLKSLKRNNEEAAVGISPAKKLAKMMKEESESSRKMGVKSKTIKKLKEEEDDHSVSAESKPKSRRLAAAVAMKRLEEKEKEENGGLKCKKEAKKRKQKILSSRGSVAEKKVKMEKEESKEEEEGDDSDDDEDFKMESFKEKGKRGKKNTANVTRTKPKSNNNKNNNNSKTNNKKKKVNNGIDYWIEIYLPQVGWTCCSCWQGRVDDRTLVEEMATSPISYVISIDDYVRDVTPRYSSTWMTSSRKLRISSIDEGWWDATLSPYLNPNKKELKEEDEMIERILLSHPLPTTISAYKDHPMFVLRRHLLKYEAIYPHDIDNIGYIRSEEILPRSSVHTLHTRDKWLQQALSVREAEVPYKMVASYLKNKKLNKKSDTPSLPLFGKWQTEKYRPPIAQNGKVPRNNYGNVDLFKPEMLPIGCVHLRLNNLNSVARKLDIDCASAVIGFDTHNSFPHPVIDGFVVCEEHEEILRSAWKEDAINLLARRRKKKEDRIYSSWKKLIRGLRARERVKRKYGSSSQQQSDNVAGGIDNWQAEKYEPEKGRNTTRRGRKKQQLPVVVERLEDD